jgi:signal transduction histidine kinase
MTLISNAKDALEGKSEGGVVRVETRNTVSAAGSAELELLVSDNGCGMNSNALSQVFDAFYTTKAPGKGSGLGLAIVHSIVTSMNARIVAQSTPSVGSSFAIFFRQ